MADDPEIKEDDPVNAIRSALNKALNTLKKLLGQEEEELEEELSEVGGKDVPSSSIPNKGNSDTQDPGKDTEDEKPD